MPKKVIYPVQPKARPWKSVASLKSIKFKNNLLICNDLKQYYTMKYRRFKCDNIAQEDFTWQEVWIYPFIQGSLE